MMTTQITIPTDWDTANPSTWVLTQTVDARIGTHASGATIREYRDITLRAMDLGMADNVRYDDATETYRTTDGSDLAEQAEWWTDVLTAKLDADVAIAEATQDEIDAIADLIEMRRESDDLEIEAAHCRAITAALRG